MAVSCIRCNGMGFFIYVWTIEESPQIYAHRRFPVPCAFCSLGAYTTWILDRKEWLQELGLIVNSETYRASA